MLMNAIASLTSAMSYVAVVAAERVIPVGIVWEFAIADMLTQFGSSRLDGPLTG